MGTRMNPDFLERLVGKRGQGRSRGVLRGTLWSRYIKRAVIFVELHSCSCCRDCGFLTPDQFVLVTWDLGSGFS